MCCPYCIATLCIATFFVSTVLVDLLGSHETVAWQKSLVAMPSLAVSVPAIVLNQWSAAGSFDTSFYVVQAIDLLVGAVELSLMALNIRDGLSMSRRLRSASVEPMR